MTRPYSEHGAGKRIANYRHNHSPVKDVFVDTCPRCSFILDERQRRADRDRA